MAQDARTGHGGRETTRWEESCNTTIETVMLKAEDVTGRIKRTIHL